MNSLQRIILIDSYMPGIVELKVDKHTNICGINASGKTTLQRLILVFYGELPSHVVPRTRDSFEKWYLPRHSSYLVFEYYNHHNKLNQVVLSASADGRSVNYRFIDHGYELDHFVSRTINNKHEFYSAQELGRQLKSAKIDCSTLLGSMEYRAVIQHDKTLSRSLSRHKDIIRFTRQHSLCGSQHSLRHVEKLVQAIHTKAGKMNSIKTMIAAILEEDGVQPPSIQIKSSNVENWAAKSLVVEDMMQRQKEMSDLSHFDSQVNYIELQLCKDKAFLQVAFQACFAETESDEKQLKVLKQAFQKIEESWLNKRDDLTQEITQTKSTIDDAERRLSQIEIRYSNYLESGIETILNNINYLDSWQRDLADQQQQYSLLTEQHNDIEKTYQNRKTDILEKKDKEMGLVASALDTRQREKTDLIAKHSTEQRADEKKHHQVVERLNQDYAERIAIQTQTVNKLESQFEFMGATEQEQQEITVLDTRLDKFEQQRVAELGKHKQSALVEQQAKSELDENMASYLSACKAVAHSESLLERARKLRYPEDGSLLQYLRTDNEQWAVDIGKVIDPSLLDRRDLKPESQQLGDSLFGVSLDLQAIDTPEHAQNDGALRIKFTQADDQLTLDKRVKSETEARVSTARQRYEEASKKQVLLLAKVERTETQINDLKNEKSLIISRHKVNLKNRKSAVKDEIKTAQGLLNTSKKDHAEALENAKASFKEYFTELLALHSDAENEIEARLSSDKQRLSEIKADADKQLKVALQWYKATLSERGVDELAITHCRDRIKELDEAIKETIHRRTEANEFVDWKKSNIELLKPKLLKELENEKLHKNKLSTQLSTEKSEYKIQTKKAKGELSRLSNALDILRNNSKTIDRTLQTLNSLNLMPTLAEPLEPFNSEINFEALAEQTAGIELRINETTQVRERLKEKIQSFDALINRGGASELSEAWEKAREHATITDALNPDSHLLVAELEKIFNNLLPQLSETLAHEGRNYSLVIKSYYDVLADIDNKISAQAAKITRHIGEELDLEGVSESAVRIYSTVSKLKFWDNLNDFIVHYEAWRETGFSNRPEQALIESIQDVARILSRSREDKISILDVLNIELRLKEGESQLVIRTDQELVDSSSQGMAYLILCKFLLAFTRMLRGSSNVVVHWPIDELGTLHVSYIKKVFDACERNNITIVGAFPNSDTSFLKLFSNRYIMDRNTRRLTTIRSNPSLLSTKMAEYTENQNDKQERV